MAEVKHSFVEGVIEEVASASYEHNLICRNLLVLFDGALDKTDCVPLGSDMRVEFVSTRVYYYPDLVVVCSSPKLTPEDTLQNPILIVEVLSESTASNDRGDKSLRYRAMDSLQHYVLVDQYKPLLQHYERQSDGKWLVAGEYMSLDDTWQFLLNGTAITIPLTNIYRRVSFPVDEEPEIGTKP